MRLVGAIGVVVGLALSGPLALAADNGNFSLTAQMPHSRSQTPNGVCSRRKSPNARGRFHLIP